MSISTVFTNIGSQGVRLSADERLPEGANKVEVRARELNCIISPAGHTWGEFFMHGPLVSDDFMPARATQQQAERETF